MKTLTNKLVTSVLALVLTGAALSIGVFAWFTVNNTANVEQFSGTVKTGEGFYVSSDGATWVNTIDVSGLVSGVTFEAVTADLSGDLYLIDGTPAAGGTFIEFDLYFVGDSSLSTVDVTSISISSPSQTSWIPGEQVDFTDSATDGNEPVLRSASDAARVGFIDLIISSNAVIFENPEGGTNTLGKGTFTAPGQDGDNQAVLYYNHFGSTPVIDQTLFDAAYPYTAVVAGSGLNQTVTTLNAQSAATTLTSSIPAWNVPSSVTGVIGTDYNVGGVKVRVWIEGWDQEALNAILSGQVDVTINFEGAGA